MKSFTSTSSYIILSLLIFCLGSCSNANDTAAKQKPPTKVTTILIEPKDVPVSFEFVAQTQSSHLVNIQARVNGFLEKRVYTEGQMVTKGQVLFIMDEKPFQVQVEVLQAAVNRQEAALETARLNLARVKPLSEQNALSQKDLDEANGTFLANQASLEQAKAQLETAKLNLSYTTITSPIDGITSSARQQEGAYLNVQDSLLTTVSKISPIWVNFSLSENELQAFRDEVLKGQLVVPKDEEFVVKIIQVNGQIFPNTGKITFTEPYFNPQTGTFLIRASVENPKGILRPNQYVRAKVEGAIRPDAILVPQRAVLQSAKGHFVWVVNKESKAEFRPVHVGDWKNEDWFITEGLLPGDQVIINGSIALHPGDLVQPIVQPTTVPASN